MDETRKESIKPLIHAWMQERLRSLQDQVLLTWEEGMGRLRPDDTLLNKILELAEAEPVPDLVQPPMEVEKDLGKALDLLDGARSQGEVLKNFLEGLKPFAERSAIFVVKSGMSSLYYQRGFDLNASRPSSPVMPTQDLDDLIQGRVDAIQRPGAAYKALLEPLSRFEAADVIILPLCLRRRPVALLLADCGLNSSLNSRQLVRALTRCTEAALSHQAAASEEKSGSAPPSAPPPPPPPPPPVPQLAPPVLPVLASSVVQVPNINSMPLPEISPLPDLPSLDPKVRANAERSARVLIGDIELYSPAKVSSGKAQRNLYAMLKDELERSRASFVDRYGVEIEQTYHIFYNTLVQQLCDGDPSRLGPNPWTGKAS